jgi:formate dehydrogenase iron-sulfur subunit
MTKEYSILLDSTRCSGCNACSEGCVRENRFHASASRGFFRTIVLITDQGLFHQRCMHCKDPACVAVCPSGALRKTASGAVTYESDLCSGCSKCESACPFCVPLFDPVSRKIVKCGMCAPRTRRGEAPACVSACPTGALRFGSRAELLRLAQNRASSDRLRLYGAKENGGSNFLILKQNGPESDFGKRAEKPVNFMIGLSSDSAVAFAGMNRFGERTACFLKTVE